MNEPVRPPKIEPLKLPIEKRRGLVVPIALACWAVVGVLIWWLA